MVRNRLLLLGSALLISTVACSAPAPPEAPPAGSGNEAFGRLTAAIIAEHVRRHPTEATDLGIHTYDDQLEDFSRAGITAELGELKGLRHQLDVVDEVTLTADKQLDRQQLMRALDSDILSLAVIKPWSKNADVYSSGITNAAFVLVKRNFAPPAERLKHLIDREKKMPDALAAARTNLTDVPAIYTQIAIEQIDGSRNFFKSVAPAAFQDVQDAPLLAEFKTANDAVVAALGEYKTFLENTLLPASKGSYALGADAYVRELAADEMIDTPLDQLLTMAEADRAKNEAAFVALAKQIGPDKSAAEVLASLQVDHPPAPALLETTQNTLDSVRQFIADRHIITIPPSDPVHVRETPPFLRSTTTASMDTPGPFEKAPTEAFYYMTLPDPRWPPARQADYMRQWYYAAIVNVSVHEVYPGHYVQFLYSKNFPSDVRKVYGARTNIEGWAHYCEQLMFDEGFHADEPKYRLAQIQDALLRDVRFAVGIKMHTQQMTVDEAANLFETQAHQPAPVAMQEAKRGTSDPMYGYYTMGKLMILKLRNDYKQKLGSAYTLQGFHDEFVALGPLPLPLIRKAMLGETGQLF